MNQDDETPDLDEVMVHLRKAYEQLVELALALGVTTQAQEEIKKIIDKNKL